jgi:hypothetical protein
LGYQAEPAGESGAVATAGRHAQQPVRRAEHQHGQQQQAIQHHHHLSLILSLPGASAKMIINLAMKSYRFATIPLLVISATPFFTAISHAADKKAPPIKPAGQYAAFDTHPNEHVTVAADPCDDPKDCSFFRLPYIQHGYIPIRVVFTNDGDMALSLDDARMQFISVNNDVIPAATDEELDRRLFSSKNAKGRQIPLPMPLPPITLHGKPIAKDITLDEKDFGFNGTTVNAHSTLGGYLFYDVRQLDDPPMKGAQIYVKMVHTLDGKKQLFSFTIPLDKWLAAQPGEKPAPQSPEE